MKDVAIVVIFSMHAIFCSGFIMNGLSPTRLASNCRDQDSHSGYIIDVHEEHPKVAEIALLHCNEWDAYLSNTVVAKHTSIAFAEALEFVDNFYAGKYKEKRVILDSGCGVGLSTLQLAAQNPDTPVIGIDRSFVRLTKEIKPHLLREAQLSDFVEAVNKVSDKDNNNDGQPTNYLFLRAELADFWMLVARNTDWIVDRHYLLYPNPYPKAKHLRRRWHGE